MVQIMITIRLDLWGYSDMGQGAFGKPPQNIVVFHVGIAMPRSI